MLNQVESEKKLFQINFSTEEIITLLQLLKTSPEYDLEQQIIRQLEAQQYFNQTEEEKMTYSGFTNWGLIKTLQLIDSTNRDTHSPLVLKIERKALYKSVPPISVGGWLRETLDKGTTKNVSLVSEKIRSEAIIYPILVDLLNRNPEKFTLFSGERFDVDRERGLSGECDFLLSYSSAVDLIQVPVFTLVEAKKKDIDEGLPQCAAQMIAAWEFNRSQGREIPAVFGCVTTGKVWKFMQLANHTITIDEDEYYEKLELEKILGILQYIVDFFESGEENGSA